MFNVGDRVKVLKNTYTSHYDEYIGTEATVVGINESFEFPVDLEMHDGEWLSWSEDELELVPQGVQVKIKYFTPECTIEKTEVGDWIDLRSAIDITYVAGEFHLIPLGVAMELPKGYEAHVIPRSSTFKNFGILQTNSFGLIDESYKGDDDQWFFPMYSLRDGEIHKGDRICQFRISRKMEPLELTVVDNLGNNNRGGHGSSGVL